MNTISILKSDITNLDTDAVVNAANSGLQAGSGVCGAIFKAAGFAKLQAACDAIGYCDTGSAVITPGFDMKAKYIIHAVGPRWVDGWQGEEKLLRGAYMSSLQLALENGCASIGFPLISSGVFGYPMEEAWAVAIIACLDFFQQHETADLQVVFAVRDDHVLYTGKQVLANSMHDPSRFRAEMPQPVREQLMVSGRLVDAVFFHKPEEPEGWLSNWYPSEITVDGVRFSSVEQYIMYKKCRVFGDSESAEAVLATEDTRLQQTIGRNAKGYISGVWAGMRQAVLLRGLLAKFSQNPDLKQKLLDTGNAWLVECAGTDKVWACGRRLDDARRYHTSKWDGQNILGFALMEVREMLK